MTRDEVMALTDEQLVAGVEGKQRRLAPVVLICEQCKTPFKIRVCDTTRGRRFCSHKCSQLKRRKYTPIEFMGIMFRFNKRTGYFSSSKTGKILHREIWTQRHGEIPIGHVIHHKDENKTNNLIENLELREWAEHTRHHNLASPRRLPIRPKTFCKEPGCSRQAKARGLCTKHYQRLMAAERGSWL